MVDKVLADLETDVSKDALRTLLSHTRRLTDFYDRANGVMTVLDDLLEDGQYQSQTPSRLYSF